MKPVTPRQFLWLAAPYLTGVTALVIIADTFMTPAHRAADVALIALIISAVTIACRRPIETAAA